MRIAVNLRIVPDTYKKIVDAQITSLKRGNMTYQDALKDIKDNGIDLGGGDYVDLEALKVAAEALQRWIEIDQKLFIKDCTKLKEGLKRCTDYLSCDECPYNESHLLPCTEALMMDASRYIESVGG